MWMIINARYRYYSWQMVQRNQLLGLQIKIEHLRYVEQSEILQCLLVCIINKPQENSNHSGQLTANYDL